MERRRQPLLLVSLGRKGSGGSETCTGVPRTLGTVTAGSGVGASDVAASTVAPRTGGVLYVAPSSVLQALQLSERAQLVVVVVLERKQWVAPLQPLWPLSQQLVLH